MATHQLPLQWHQRRRVRNASFPGILLRPISQQSRCHPVECRLTDEFRDGIRGAENYVRFWDGTSALGQTPFPFAANIGGSLSSVKKRLPLERRGTLTCWIAARRLRLQATPPSRARVTTSRSFDNLAHRMERACSGGILTGRPRPIRFFGCEAAQREGHP